MKPTTLTSIWPMIAALGVTVISIFAVDQPAPMGAFTTAEAREMVDHASRQSDRWLFLATAAGFGGCLVAAVVYQTRNLRAVLDELRQDRHETNEVIKSNTRELIRVTDRLDRVAK